MISYYQYYNYILLLLLNHFILIIHIYQQLFASNLRLSLLISEKNLLFSICPSSQYWSTLVIADWHSLPYRIDFQAFSYLFPIDSKPSYDSSTKQKPNLISLKPKSRLSTVQTLLNSPQRFTTRRGTEIMPKSIQLTSSKFWLCFGPTNKFILVNQNSFSRMISVWHNVHDIIA